MVSVGGDWQSRQRRSKVSIECFEDPTVVGDPKLSEEERQILDHWMQLGKRRTRDRLEQVRQEEGVTG